jgi:hypothetical protein
MVMLHQDSFAADYQEDEYALLGMARQRIRREAVQGISGALRRVADSADLDGLSLEVDRTGVELIHQGAAGEEVNQQRTA